MGFPVELSVARTVRRRTGAALVTFALAVTACGGGDRPAAVDTTAVAPPAAEGGDPTAEEPRPVDDELDGVDPNDPETLASAGHGMVRALLASIGVEATDDVLRAIAGAGAEVDMAAGTGVRTNGVEHAAGRALRPSETSALGTATGQGFATAIQLVGDAVSGAMRGRDVNSDDPNRTVNLSSGRLDASIDVTGTHAQGETTATMSNVTTVGTMLCPDADGIVRGDVDSVVHLDLAASGGTYSVVVELRSQFEVTADDTATIVSVAHDSEGAFTETGHVVSGEKQTRAGFYTEVATSADVDVSGPEWVARSGEAQIVRRSSQTSQDVDLALAKATVKLTTMLAWTMGDEAQKYWRSGACVEVPLTPSAGPSDLTSGQQVSVQVAPIAVTDGLPTGGRIVVRLIDGGAGVDPSGIPIDAPATVTYTAPDSGSGTIEAESTSRRGIGRGTLRLETAAGWVVEGSDGVFDVRGVKCGAPSGRWTFVLSARFDGATFTGKVEADLDPETLTGTYQLTGVTSGGRLTIPQTGSGTIRFVVDGPDAGHIEFEAGAWTSGSNAGGSQGMGVIPARRADAADC